MPSKFTATRRTRKRPPICHTALLDPKKLATPAHPAVITCYATWIDTPGVPPVNVHGLVTMIELLPGTKWHGTIYYETSILDVTIAKSPGAAVCTVELQARANGIPEVEEWVDVPCPPDMCQWRSPKLERIYTPGLDYRDFLAFS